MSWSPIPDDDWAPLEQERDKFFSVYIDETSQTKHRYLMIGGLAVPLSHTGQQEADIIAAREGHPCSGNTTRRHAAHDEMAEAQRIQFRRLQKGSGHSFQLQSRIQIAAY